MGREAEGHAVWRGQSGAVKAYLEGDGITLRGELRARLRREGLMGWRVEGDDLCLRSGDEPLILTLGAKEAAAWVRALERPVPGLAAKLGLMGAERVWVIGGPAPGEVSVAVAGAGVSGPEGAAMIVAVLTGPDDLALALEAGQASGLRVWAVHGKGKAAAVTDAEVRAAFRAAEWMDIKTSAVSDTFTATLYRPPKD
jgi:hypothetical protein